MKSMQLVWTTAHSAMTEDMREMLARFNQATPLHLTSQLHELRRDLTTEIAARSQAMEYLSSLLTQVQPSSTCNTSESIPRCSGSPHRIAEARLSSGRSSPAFCRPGTELSISQDLSSTASTSGS